MSNFNQLQEFIRVRASKVGWTATPQEWQPVFEAEEKESACPMEAIVVDIHYLLLAHLPSDVKSARRSWAFAQKQAAVARTHHAASFGDDLMLLLVGPAGSITDEEWISLGMEIERNDLVCRKLLWLPPSSEKALAGSMESFLRRTFLTKPWMHTGGMQVALDRLAETSDDLRGWSQILDEQPVSREDVDYDRLIAALIKSHEL